MADFTLEAHVKDAILAHMNNDHADDNVLIVRAFGARDAVAARMTEITETDGTWIAETPMEEVTVRIPWSRRLTSRGDARAEVVALQERALASLG